MIITHAHNITLKNNNNLIRNVKKNLMVDVVKVFSPRSLFGALSQESQVSQVFVILMVLWDIFQHGSL